ncbi:MAG: ubiquinol-cytochrome c reductase iron-sulfur subunit [Pseudomonadota bacterium]
MSSDHAEHHDGSGEHVADTGRRKMLTITTAALGAVGGGALVVPFAGSLVPSERAKSAGAPVEVDISKIEAGQQLTYEWRGKPVWVINRTPEMLGSLSELTPALADPNSNLAQQPAYAQNEHRSIREDILVLVGICTHLGCSPKYLPEVADNWEGGFLCACHGSTFDLAGRVFSGVPAPKNLEVPPHKYLSDNLILVGDDSGAAS